METNLKPIDFNTIETELKTGETQFPIEVFPELFRDLITDFKDSLNFPTDYTGTAILTAIATAIGTTAKVNVQSGWEEYASLYVALIGNAGASKTHPVKKAFEAIKEIDKIALKKYIFEATEYDEYLNLDKKTKDLTPKVNKPKLPKSILNNFTPESLNQRLNENLRGCAIVSDELISLFEGMNNYSKSDQLSLYLSLWNFQSITVDRIGNAIPMDISNPLLSIIGGLQPRILKQAFTKQKMDNGFLPRFLFAFPDNSMKPYPTDNEMNSEGFRKYNEFIFKYINNHPLVVDENGIIESKKYYWSDDAKQYFKDYRVRNCDLVNSNQHSLKAEIITKFDNHFIRLALILQIMENYNTYEIGIKAVKGADELCKYFMNCAFKVLGVIQDLKTYTDTLPNNKKGLYNELPISFTTETAINLGANYGIADRTVKEFIKDALLFERVKHGVYNKIIKS
jgi:hypothetical protein